jgi:hypothetical protein
MEMRVFLFSIIILFALPSFATTQSALIIPPNGGSNANVYSEPGYDWKTCGQTQDCSVVVLTRKGDTVKVLDRGVMRNSKRFYAVEVDSLNGKKTGYIEESYLFLTGMPEPECDETTASKLISAAGNMINNFFADDSKPPTLDVSTTVRFRDLNNPQIYNPLCKNLMDEFGNPGPWGTRMLQAMHDVDASSDLPSCFYERINVRSVCPKFPNLSQQEKMRFWLWTFVVKAQEESSCNPAAQAPGVNGLADGLFQMEYSRVWRAKAERNEHFCKTKESIDTQDLAFQFECTASTLKDMYCDKNLALVNPRGYWQNMNDLSRRISQRIATYPGCK